MIKDRKSHRLKQQAGGFCICGNQTVVLIYSLERLQERREADPKPFSLQICLQS